MINSFVFIKAFIREGWINRETGKKGDPRVQYNNFVQLQDVMENYAKKLTIKLNIDQIQKDRIRVLKDTLASYKGKNSLNFVVYEMKEEIKVNLSSRKQQVQITSELLSDLDEQEVHYTLN